MRRKERRSYGCVEGEGDEMGWDEKERKTVDRGAREQPAPPPGLIGRFGRRVGSSGCISASNQLLISPKARQNLSCTPTRPWSRRSGSPSQRSGEGRRAVLDGGGRHSLAARLSPLLFSGPRLEPVGSPVVLGCAAGQSCGKPDSSNVACLPVQPGLPLEILCLSHWTEIASYAAQSMASVRRTRSGISSRILNSNI